MTWKELALAAGAQSDEEADYLLWAGSCFPFGTPCMVWYQLRHTIRHKVCVDQIEARCAGPAFSK